MSHIFTYSGRGGFLLYIPFKYLETRACSDNFSYPLIATTLGNALRAAHNPLYKQPLRYIICMLIQCATSACIHVPSFKHWLISGLCWWSPRFQDNFSNFWWKFCVSESLPDKWTASSFLFGHKGYCNPLLDGSVKTFGGSTTGKFGEEAPSSKPELCHPPWNNHDPHCHFSSDLWYGSSYQAKWRKSVEF